MLSLQAYFSALDMLKFELLFAYFIRQNVHYRLFLLIRRNSLFLCFRIKQMSIDHLVHEVFLALFFIFVMVIQLPFSLSSLSPWLPFGAIQDILLDEA